MGLRDFLRFGDFWGWIAACLIDFKDSVERKADRKVNKKAKCKNYMRLAVLQLDIRRGKSG